MWEVRVERLEVRELNAETRRHREKTLRLSGFAFYLLSLKTLPSGRWRGHMGNKKGSPL
jgi:hypothetical protein